MQKISQILEYIKYFLQDIFENKALEKIAINRDTVKASFISHRDAWTNTIE